MSDGNFPVFQRRRLIPSGGVAVPIDPRTAGALGGSVQRLAQAAGNLSLNVGDRIRRQNEAEDAAFATQVTADIAQTFTATFNKRQEQAVGQARGFAGQIVNDYDVLVAERLKAAPSPRARALANQRLTRSKTSFANKALDFEFASRQGELTRQVEEGLEQLGIAGFTSPEDYLRFLAQGKGDIDAAEALYMIPKEALRLREKFPGDLAVAAMRGRIALDPKEALSVLRPDADEFDPMVARIPADQRQILFTNATARVAANEAKQLRLLDQAEAAEDKAAKLAQEASFAQRVGDISEGGISEETIIGDLQARRINRAQFNSLMAMQRRGEEESEDPLISLSLTREALDGDPGLEGRVTEALERGQITGAQARGLLDKADQVKRRGGVLANNEVQRSRKRVDENLVGRLGPFASLDTAEAARVSNALDEFDERVIAGENPRPVADDIIKRFRITPPAPTEFARPSFLVGSQSEPDLEETRRATIEALDSGEISEEEAGRELLNLERIEDAIQEGIRMRGGDQ